MMKNYNILGFHWKIWLSGGQVHKKLMKRGPLPKMGWLGQLAGLRGRGLGKKEEVVLLMEGWYPDKHYALELSENRW